MRLKNNTLSFVVNFLLGVAWAIVLLGSIISFLSFYHENILLAFVAGCLGAIPGMLAVLFIENIITTKEQHVELQKQTKLLEELLSLR
jgi:uncharacterized membrane protein required for colicin V production